MFRPWVELSLHREWGKVLTSSSKDMVEKVALTPGAIGYVERSFAERESVSYGSVQNRAGKFVEPSTASIDAACKARQRLTSGEQASLIYAEGEDSYPLASFALGLRARFGFGAGAQGSAPRVPCLVPAGWPDTHGGTRLLPAAACHRETLPGRTPHSSPPE